MLFYFLIDAIFYSSLILLTSTSPTRYWPRSRAAVWRR